MKTFKTMLATEYKLSLRGMDMFIFAICMPLVVLVILGMIYGNRPAFEGAHYSLLEQSFSALAAISILAGGVMGLPLVISDYRSKHILKRFKATPVSPAMLLLVQVVIFTLYALTSLVSLYIVASLFFDYQFHGSLFHFFVGYILVILSIFSIGMMVGGLAPDTRSASAIASILYFPMLIFSGATVPYAIMPPSLQSIADVMPLTQGIHILQSASLGLEFDRILAPTIVMLILSITCTVISLRFFKWE